MNFKSVAFPAIIAGFLSSHLNATPIFQSRGSGGNTPTLLYNSPFIDGRGSYDGAALIGETMLGNSGSATEQAWVESLISGSLPALPNSFFEPGGETSGPADKTYSVSLPGSWDYGYYMAKWGAGQSGADHALWLITADDLLQYQLPNELSHSKIWVHPIYVETEPNRVPEVVSTFALLAGSSVLLFKLRARTKA